MNKKKLKKLLVFGAFCLVTLGSTVVFADEVGSYSKN